MIITINVPDVWTTWVLVVGGWTLVIGYVYLTAELMKAVAETIWSHLQFFYELPEISHFAVEYHKQKKRDEAKNG